MRSIALRCAQALRPLLACGRWLRLRCKRAAFLNRGLSAEFKLPQASLLFEACGPGAQPWFAESKGPQIRVFGQCGGNHSNDTACKAEKKIGPIC